MNQLTIHPHHLKPGDIILWGGEWRTIHTARPSIVPGRTVLWVHDTTLRKPFCIGTFRNTTDIPKR